MPDSRSSLTRFPVNSRHVKPDPQAATPLICCAAKESSGAAVLIEWTPKLENVITRLRAMRKERRGFAPQLFTTQTGSVYTYWGASSAWKRAVKRAGVAGVHFHDLRAKALTDVDELRGMGAARTMGAPTAPRRKRPTTCEIRKLGRLARRDRDSQRLMAAVTASTLSLQEHR